MISGKALSKLKCQTEVKTKFNCYEGMSRAEQNLYYIYYQKKYDTNMVFKARNIAPLRTNSAIHC